MVNQTEDGIEWEETKSNPAVKEIRVSFALTLPKDGDTQLGLNALAVARDCINLLVRKNHDYGKANITDFGLLGVIVRANDKIKRLWNISLKEMTGGKAAVKEETKKDTLQDVVNYGIIGTLVHDKKW